MSDPSKTEPAPDAGRDESVVAEEFAGLDNDLIDMNGFGATGPGPGTQTGGAGESRRPSPGKSDTSDQAMSEYDRTSGKS